MLLSNRAYTVTKVIQGSSTYINEENERINFDIRTTINRTYDISLARRLETIHTGKGQ